MESVERNAIEVATKDRDLSLFRWSNFSNWFGPASVKPTSVLFLAEGPTACSEIILEPFMTLAAENEIELRVLYESEYSGWKLRRIARNYDVLFAFRSCTPRAAKICDAAKRAGKFVVWSSDDDLLSLDSDNPAGKRHEHADIRNATESMMRNADQLWLFSQKMCQRYEHLGVPTTFTRVAVPTVPDTPPQDTACSHDTFTIGHIGDYSHAPEMELLVETLERLEHANLPQPWRFDFVGYTPEPLQNHPNVRSVPYISGLENFHRWLKNANWNVGVAPLRATRFNECKTDNKFRTFAAFGIPGVYSASSPYTESVTHCENGLLVEHSAEAFTDAIAMLARDPSLRTRIQSGAKRACDTLYSSDAITDLYRRFFALRQCGSNARHGDGQLAA